MLETLRKADRTKKLILVELPKFVEAFVTRSIGTSMGYRRPLTIDNNLTPKTYDLLSQQKVITSTNGFGTCQKQLRSSPGLATLGIDESP
eukprot:5961751-Amphidinium_carterae.1